MRARVPQLLAAAAVVALSMGAPSPSRAAAPSPIKTSYLYHLSTATGVIPFSGARLSYDGAHRELYVIGDAGLVRVFNDAGMEIFSFGDNPELGTIASVAPLENGDLVVLTYFDAKPAILRLNFRGEKLGAIDLGALPSQYGDFHPAALRYSNGNVYLADLAGLRFLVVDLAGNFVRFHDVLPMLKLEESKRADYGIKGFNVDRDGNILFTIQALFRAFVLPDSGKLQAFGERGSGPGKFNVVTGISSDEQGNLYIADILKSVVLVFDREFRYLREFGFRGGSQANLISPIDVASGNGKVFVSQYARRGVSVFEVQPAN